MNPSSSAPALERAWRVPARFRSEVAAELAKRGKRLVRNIEERELAGLPAPVQRFFRASGLVGTPHTLNARIVWRELLLRRSRRSLWMKLCCEQFASVPEPTRIALMTGKLGGVLRLEGRDKYQHGHGQMLITLMKVITVADARGRYMDESALVTLLSELPLVPSFALQKYLTWTAIDDRSARASITDHGLTVSGTFHFNDADECVRFDTDDRWRSGKTPRRTPWSAYFGGYETRGGLRTPYELSATWHEAAGDFTYARGTLESIAFNLEHWRVGPRALVAAVPS
ncbi:MAG: hypothetical protein RLZZ450_4158 [Pseudomonadota bacterium]|jgi:hypothetical protein